MTENQLFYLLALQRIPNIGEITAKKLINHFGSAEEIFKASPREIRAINGISTQRTKDLTDETYLDQAEKEMRFIADNQIAVKSYQDKDYPAKLKQCVDSPLLLFQRGNIDLRNRRIISIVGTRKATTSGIDFCRELIETIAPMNPVIISGFAYGIDITAHKAAIRHNLQTVACMAHGLNQIYPKPHATYKTQVEENGGFISDFWSDKKFDRKNFLKRNRIIAGLSEATLVLESAEKGGSLVTADMANNYNREVFAVPGRPTDKRSAGCNNLIKKQKAHLISTPADLIYMLNWDIAKETQKPVQPKLFVDLNENEQKIVDSLEKLGKTELDDIALESGLPTFKIAGLLLNLELHGIIRPLPGNQYELIG